MTFNCSLNNGHPVTEFKSILMAEILPLHRLGEKKWHYTWTSILA